jgi:hypothetical protein
MTKKQIEKFTKKLNAAVERDPELKHPAWREIEALLRRILASK